MSIVFSIEFKIFTKQITPFNHIQILSNNYCNINLCKQSKVYKQLEQTECITITIFLMHHRQLELEQP